MPESMIRQRSQLPAASQWISVWGACASRPPCATVLVSASVRQRSARNRSSSAKPASVQNCRIHSAAMRTEASALGTRSRRLRRWPMC
jgi:hypothetical protein